MRGRGRTWGLAMRMRSGRGGRTWGPDNDNIFTVSGTGVGAASLGGTPATPLFPLVAMPGNAVGKTGRPFDIIMVPVRDAGTGGM